MNRRAFIRRLGMTILLATLGVAMAVVVGLALGLLSLCCIMLCWNIGPFGAFCAGTLVVIFVVCAVAVWRDEDVKKWAEKR
jgi:hypothetical protein